VTRLLAAGLALLAALPLALPARAGRLEVRDMTGRPVSVPARPARVVSLAPSLTETVFALGAGERLVGVTDHCDHPPAAGRIARIGGIYTPNLEAILSLRPDLVLATAESNRPEDVRAIEALGAPVFVVRPVDVASVLESVERVGAVLGLPGEGRRLRASLRAGIDAVTAAVGGAPRPRVLYVVWGEPLVVPGRGVLITELIHLAGGESITAALPAPYPRLSVEEALAGRPEWVVLGETDGRPVEARLREWGALALLPAVREGRVRAIDGDLVHRPGPRVLEALRALAAALHPGRVR
jgi:iron complex transport system substrate-binding protein